VGCLAGAITAKKEGRKEQQKTNRWQQNKRNENKRWQEKTPLDDSFGC
jgi:hypothetical protein